jgi:hypothetical protein
MAEVKDIPLAQLVALITQTIDQQYAHEQKENHGYKYRDFRFEVVQGNGTISIIGPDTISRFPQQQPTHSLIDRLAAHLEKVTKLTRYKIKEVFYTPSAFTNGIKNKIFFTTSFSQTAIEEQQDNIAHYSKELAELQMRVEFCQRRLEQSRAELSRLQNVEKASV